MQTTTLHSPIGKLKLYIQQNKLTKVDFLPEDATIEPPQDKISQHICNELEKYFKNPNHQFDIEFELAGTEFQKKVWQTLRTIPAGKTETYSSLAELLKTGARAIGNACRTNPIPIIIPCHRIVGKNHLGGYVGNIEGKLMDTKKWLLKHESQ